MISMEKDCFENVPDGALLLEMIQKLIELYPEDLQKEIRKFGELDENIPDLDCLKAEEIRNKFLNICCPKSRRIYQKVW